MNDAGRPRDQRIDTSVLEATIRLLAGRGYAELRINDIAAESGVAKTTIYRRWPTMTHLVIAAIERAIGDRAIPITGDFNADLARAISAGNSILGGDDTMLTAIALDIHRHKDPELHSEYRQRIIEPFRAHVICLIADAIGHHVIPSTASPADLADAIIGGLIYKVVFLGEPFSQTRADAFARSLLSAPADETPDEHA